MPVVIESVCPICVSEWEGPGGELCPDCALDQALAEVAVGVNPDED